MSRSFLIPVIIACLAITGCNSGSGDAGSDRIRVLCTTGIIADGVRHCLPGEFSVDALMGPGVDPHLYKPTPSDISALQKADIVVYNGLHLEGKMVDVLEKLAHNKMVVAMADPLDTRSLLKTADNTYDPHIWFDPELWSAGLEHVSASISDLFPDQRQRIDSLFQTYMEVLALTDHYCEELWSEIPAEKRIMVTAHDAFQYYARRYNIRLNALQGISTQSEYGIKDVLNLAGFVIENKVNTVYFESSVPKRSIEALREACAGKNHQVNLGGPLYSDALGPEDSRADTHTGMLEHNTRLITSGIR